MVVRSIYIYHACYIIFRFNILSAETGSRASD